MSKTKKILFVLSKAPHSGVYTYESLDLIMTAAAFDQEVSVILLDDAVFNLKAKQGVERMRSKDTATLFAALSVYGIENIFVETESLQDKGLAASDLAQAVTQISRQEVGEFMKQFDVIL